MTVFGQVSHSASALTLRVISQLDSYGLDESFGFRDVNLIFASSTETNVNNLCGLSSLPLPSNQCSCSFNEYFDTVGSMSCQNCDPSCRSCFGPTSQECYECQAGYSFVDSECIKCDESCADRSGPNENQCINCPTGKFLLSTGICISNCASTSISSSTVLVCDSPCPIAGQFYFPKNQTCSDDCNLPFTQETLASGAQICVNPCDTIGGFLSWDQTCISQCPPPLQRIDNICLYNCVPEQFLYWDGSCRATCDSSLVPNSYKNRQFCQHPCPDPTDYIYWNGTCHNTCSFPLFGGGNGIVNHCILPCSQGMFISWDGFSCLETCDLPFRAREEDKVLLCEYPCGNSEYLYWNGGCSGTCDEPYQIYSLGPDMQICSYFCEQYGEYFYPKEGKCLPTCDAPYTPKIQLMDGSESWEITCVHLGEITGIGGGSNGDDDDGVNFRENPIYFTITAIKITSEKVLNVFIALDIVVSLLRDSHVMILIFVIKIMSFMKYIDIRVPPQLVQEFNSYDNNHYYLNFGPGMSEATKDGFTKSSLPMVLVGLHSRFLVNFFKPITSFLIMLGFMMMIAILQRILRGKMSNRVVLVKMILRRLEYFLKWNLVVLLVACNIDQVTLYGIIEWKSERAESSQDAISLVVSLGVSLVSLCAMIAPFYLLRKIYKTRFKVLSNQANEPYFNLLKKIEGFRLLWKDFKDSTWAQKAFLPLYNLRVALIYMIIALLYKHPMLQMVLIISISLAMLIFMITVKPFLKKLDFIQSVMYEVCMIISLGSFLILSIFDSAQVSADQVWLFLGDCIQFSNIWICIAAVVFFVYRFYVEVKRVWIFYKGVPKSTTWTEFMIMFLKEDDPVSQELKKNKRTSRRLDLTNLEREIEKKNLARYNISLTPDLPSPSSNDQVFLRSIPRKGELRIRRSLFGVKIQSVESENSPNKTQSPLVEENSLSTASSIDNLKVSNKIKIFNEIKKTLQDAPKNSHASENENKNNGSEGLQIDEKSDLLIAEKSPEKRKFSFKELEPIKEVDSMEISRMKSVEQTKRLGNVGLPDSLRGDLNFLSVVNKRLSSETVMQIIEEVEIIKEKVDLVKKKLTTAKEENLGGQGGLFE